jgi:hypothetical protein
MGMKNHFLHMFDNSRKGERAPGIHLQWTWGVPKKPLLTGAGPDGAPRG